MSYIIYHPDTGTIIPAEDTVVINTRRLPDDYDEWEDYLSTNDVPWLDVQSMIEDRLGI